MESTTFQAILSEGEVNGRRVALSEQLRDLLGAAAEPLIPRLLLCTPEALKRGSRLVVRGLPAEQLLGELERLLPRGEGP